MQIKLVKNLNDFFFFSFNNNKTFLIYEGFLEAKEIDNVIQWTLQAYPGSDYEKYKAQLLVKIDENQVNVDLYHINN